MLGRVPLITDNEIKASHLFRVKSTNLATQEESNSEQQQVVADDKWPVGRGRFPRAQCHVCCEM